MNCNQQQQKRLFIMEHLAKMRLMESLGLGQTVPSLADVLKKYREGVNQNLNI